MVPKLYKGFAYPLAVMSQSISYPSIEAEIA